MFTDSDLMIEMKKVVHNLLGLKHEDNTSYCPVPV